MKLRPAPAKLPERVEKRSFITTLLFGLLFVAFLAESPLEADNVLYHGLWRSVFEVFGPVLASLPEVYISPWQILLIGLLPFCLRTSAAATQHSRDMDRAILAGVASIALTFLWGMLRGGVAYFAYYQVWHFLAALLIAYLLMSTVRTERDLVALGKLVVLAALIRATLCIYFYWTHLYGQVFPLPDYVTDHDDSMLWVAATLIVLIWASLKGGKAAWTIAGVTIPYLLYAVVLNNRRIAWVELGLAMLLGYLLMGAGPLRSRINRWGLRLMPAILIYVIVGANSDAPAFAPIHALMTAGSDYDASSLTRLEEDRNLLHTLFDMGNPIFGTGWGRPYDKVESYYSNYNAGWILYLYTPHNSLLGVAAFSGIVGVIGILGVVTMGAYLATGAYRASAGLVPRAGGMAALTSLAVYAAHGYGDIGFESLVGSLILGTALATAGKVAAWSTPQPAVQSASMRPRIGEPAREPRFAQRKGAGKARQRETAPAKPGNDVPGKSKRTPMRRPAR